MTPGTWRMLATFAGLALFSGAFFYAWWWLRASVRRSLATQRAIAHRAGLDTVTPQTQDPFGEYWAGRHGGGLS